MHLDERHSLPRKATTNYKAKKGKDFLTVEAIWFFAKFYAANPKAAHPAYMKEALAAKFAQISLLDRKAGVPQYQKTRPPVQWGLKSSCGA